MTTASLELLKGKGAATPAAAPKEPDPAAVAEAEAVLGTDDSTDEEEVSVDIDAMTGPELDELVKEHAIEVPVSWWRQENGVKKLTVPEKKAWLVENLSGEEEAADQGDVADAPQEAQEAPAEAVVEEPVSSTDAAVASALPDSPKAGKGKTKGKAVAKAVLTGEVVGDNELLDMIHQIENLSEKDALSMVSKLSDDAERTFFQLGGVFSVIQSHGWFSPHASFRDYVENEHGINYRRAMYWIGIYNSLTSQEIPWDKVKNVGWTKLKEIAPIMTLENLEHWVAQAKKVNALQLALMVKASQKTGVSDPGDEQSTTVMTKAFKVHGDQKETIDAALAKAKEISGTTVDTVALEHICLEYLGAAPAKGAADVPLKDSLVTAGLEAALAAFEEAFPDVALTAEVSD